MPRKTDVRERLRGRCALVTGASSGIGADVARELAAAGAHLIVAARRVDRLEALAADLRLRHGVRVDVVAADLGQSDAVAELGARVDALDRSVDVLVNSAGLGLYGRSLEIPWAKERAMLEVDVVALAGVTKQFVPAMVARGFGFVLNVASIAAYQPTPYYASYAAAKAFVLSYSEALGYELRGTGVSVTAVAPGITATEFLSVAKQRPTAYQRVAMMRSADVARSSVAAMLARKATYVPGTLNRISAIGGRLSPRALVLPVGAWMMRSNVPEH